MKRVIWGCLIPLFLFLLSCEEKPVQTDASETVGSADSSRVKKTKAQKPPPSYGSYLERRFMPQAKLYGKFFDERLQFHIVESPDLTLFKNKVESLTFYHIDEELTKKKFLMAGDISSDLMDVYGNFKFRPLDDTTKYFATKDKIIKRSNGVRHLNEGFTNYEMRWEKPDRIIRFKVSKDSAEYTYEYSEENEDYKFLLATLELGIREIDSLENLN